MNALLDALRRERYDLDALNRERWNPAPSAPESRAIRAERLDTLARAARRDDR